MKNRRRKLFYLIPIIFLLTFVTGCKQTIQVEPQQKIEDNEEKITEEEKIHVTPIVRQVKLSVVGDLMVHSWQYNEAYSKETGSYDFMHNFADIKKYFNDSDYVIGNLETVFAGEEKGASDYPCFNTPDSFGDALKDAGFDLLTTANNHCMDQHQQGLFRTIDILNNLGIAHVGTYQSQEERDTILIKEINGIKFAFLSYTYGTNGIPVPEDYMVNRMDEALIRSDIQKAKEYHPDMIVILPHMGNEYETYVRDVFKEWTDMMFDAGADIILASHPHVLQPMEYKTIINEDGSTRTGFVIYSLGNFISSQTTPPRNAGVILNIEIEKTEEEKAVVKRVSFIPTWTQFRLPNGQDRFSVKSVYDMLTLPQEEQTALLRQKDIARLRDIHYETTSMLLGKDIPIEEIQNEYEFPMD